MTVGRVLIGAGGTGGHVHPALALASELANRGHDVHFVGGNRLEATAVPEAGFELHQIPGRALPRSLSIKAALAGADLLRGIVASRRLIKRLKVDVVVGFGGYHSVAPCLAAGRNRVVLHEQNAVLSLAHRISLRAADVLAVSVPLKGRLPQGCETVRTGNPLRADVRSLAVSPVGVRAEERLAALRHFGLSPDRITVLAFGGSLGAAPINEALLLASDSLSGRSDVQIIHIAGAGHDADVRRRWASTDVPHFVADYIPQMHVAYAAADICVTRSGGAVAELTALGLPSVLIPGPWATGGHQRANAEWMSEAGAAELLVQDEPDLSGRLARAIDRLMDGPTRLAMSEASAALGLPDAAQRLADVVESRHIPDVDAI